jgi:hypothetical protein
LATTASRLGSGGHFRLSPLEERGEGFGERPHVVEEGALAVKLFPLPINEVLEPRLDAGPREATSFSIRQPS